MADIKTIALLLLGAVLLVNVSQKFRISYPIALVLCGAIIGFIPGMPEIEFDPNNMLILVLPPILYTAAFAISFREFQRNWKEIFSLALGLVVFTTLIIGILFKWMFPQYSWALAFAFGAIVSPPDAVSATTILKRFSMSPRLVSLLEGESLINDASAIVLYKMATVALLSGSFSLAEGGFDFVREVLGGVVFGFASGLLLQLLSRYFLEPVLGAVFSFTIPYSTYVVAQFLGVSGVIAVVVNGLIGSRILMTHRSSLRRVLGFASWDIYIILLNCFVFIVIGLQLKTITATMTKHEMVLYAAYALLITLAMIIVRFIWVYTKSALTYFKILYKPTSTQTGDPILSEAAILGWSGMRGIVSLAVAMGLPYTLPNGMPIEGRNVVIYMTFIVIMTTLIIPGLTLPTLIRLLKINIPAPTHELQRSRQQLAKIAEEKLELYVRSKGINKDEFSFLKTYFESHFRMLEMSYSDDHKTQKIEGIRLDIIRFQRKQLFGMWQRKEIDDIVFTRLEQELDLGEVHVVRAELK